jgi:hypothetical protein
MKRPSVLTSMICRLVEAGFEGSKETLKMPMLCRATYNIKGSVLDPGDKGNAWIDVMRKVVKNVKIRNQNMLPVMRCAAS